MTCDLTCEKKNDLVTNTGVDRHFLALGLSKICSFINTLSKENTVPFRLSYLQLQFHMISRIFLKSANTVTTVSEALKKISTPAFDLLVVLLYI